MRVIQTNQVSAQLIEDVVTHIQLLQEKVKELYNKHIKIVEIDFKKRGKVAGTCTYYNSGAAFTISLNAVLLNENTYDFIYRTVTHEFAHAVDYVVNGNWGHSKTWKHIMSLFGADNARCHSYDTTNSTVRKLKRNFIYKCNCSEHKLTKIRHNRVLNGTDYYCSKCKNILEFVKEI